MLFLETIFQLILYPIRRSDISFCSSFEQDLATPKRRFVSKRDFRPPSAQLLPLYLIFLYFQSVR